MQGPIGPPGYAGPPVSLGECFPEAVIQRTPMLKCENKYNLTKTLHSGDLLDLGWANEFLMKIFGCIYGARIPRTVGTG